MVGYKRRTYSKELIDKVCKDYMDEIKLHKIAHSYNLSLNAIKYIIYDISKLQRLITIDSLLIICAINNDILRLHDNDMNKMEMLEYFTIVKPNLKVTYSQIIYRYRLLKLKKIKHEKSNNKR